MVFQLPGCPSNKRDGPCLEVVCGVRPTLCLGVYIGCEFNSAAFFQSQSHSLQVASRGPQSVCLQSHTRTCG